MKTQKGCVIAGKNRVEIRDGLPLPEEHEMVPWSIRHLRILTKVPYRNILKNKLETSNKTTEKEGR